MNNFKLIRYSGDDPSIFGLKEEEFRPDKSEGFRKNLLANSLRITDAMFPEINQMIETVLKNLNIETNVESYISSSPEPQAMCVTQLNSVDFIIVITSSLLDLLSSAELSFVIGHEIGHYVFEHYKHPRPQDNENQLERFNKLQLSRSAEISADRVGLLATIPDSNKSNIEIAVSSMIKTVSGVSDRYFKLDIASYLNQGRDLIQLSGNEDSIHSTHPVFPDRVPALMQFELSQPYYDFIKSDKFSVVDKEKLDISIEKKMRAHSGNALEERIKDLATGFTIWATMMLVHIDGTLSEKELAALRYIFGDDVASNLRDFYDQTPINEQEMFINDMIKQEIKNIDGLSSNDKENILVNIETLASVCDGEEKIVKDRLRFIAKLLDLERDVVVRTMEFK